MSNPWEGFCEWVRSQGGNLGGILNSLSMPNNLHITFCILGHQGTYSDIGSSSTDALSQHNISASSFIQMWHILVVVLLIVWGALYVTGRRSNATDRKPKRIPDRPNNDDEGGVGGLN